MRCAKYDMASGTCLAPIRNEGESFLSEANDMANGGGVCQSPMSNPISNSYSNGPSCGYAPCPTPMGTFKQGENFTIMWIARNHATADQTPGNIALYISPVETQNQITETSTSVFANNKICQAPFISCNGQNGDFIQCYATCQMPLTTVVGIHTLWWKWAWDGHTSIYTTCADINVIAGSSSLPPSSLPSTTGAVKPATTGPVMPATTAAAKPATTSKPAPVTPSTTSAIKPSTTGSRPVTPVTPLTTAAQATVPVTTASSTVSSPECVLGNQYCASSNTYQTCTNGRSGNYWAPAQSCQTGLSCHPSPTGTNVYCY